MILGAILIVVGSILAFVYMCIDDDNFAETIWDMGIFCFALGCIICFLTFITC